MAWETGLYAHPQGARLVRVMITCKDPADADIVAAVFWREHEDEDEASIATVTIKTGKRIGFTSLNGEVMRPMDSLVQVRSEDDAPDGLLVAVGFNR